MKDIKRRMVIETPCTPEEAEMRIARAKEMSQTTIHSFGMFIELERQMSLRGVPISGVTSNDFYADNFKLHFGSMGAHEVKETCICAAIKTTCNQVIRGHRHHDCISIAMANMLDPIGLEGQGFVTSTGRYVDRFEGYQLQVAAGIESIADGGYRGIRLFSEDLY